MKLITNSSLLPWLCAYLFGIMAFLSSYASPLIMFTGLLFLIGCLFFNSNRQGFVLLVFGPLFFLIGFYAIEAVFPTRNNAFKLGENFYYARIVQPLNEGEMWSSSIVQVEGAMDLDGKWINTDEKIVLMTENNDFPLLFNDCIVFKTSLNVVEHQKNPGEFDAKKYWISKGIRYQGFCSSEQFKIVDHLPNHWFDDLLIASKTYSTNVLDTWVGLTDGPLMKAILLGDKSDLDQSTKDVFTNTGAMHMLAVSGMHIGLIVVLLLFMVKYLFFYRAKIFGMVLIIVVLWFYAFLTGFSASVVRAVLMFTVLIIGQLLKRGYHPINSLALAGFFILVIDPLAFYDIGFQLSFLAMLGIFTVFPLLENVFVFKNSILNQAWKGTAIGLASQVFTVPISIFYFNQFPNYFLLTNFSVMLFSGVMLGLAIALLAVGKLAFLSIPIGWFLALCCSVLVGSIAMVESIPYALAVGFAPHWAWVLCMYVLCLIALMWAEVRKWTLILTGLVPLLLWLQLNRHDNLNKQEWLIFNTNHPTFLFNDGGTQICFYGGNDKGKDKAVKLMKNYNRIYGGTVTYMPLSKGVFSFKVNKNRFKVAKNNGWIEIVHNQTHYAVVTSLKTPLDAFPKDTKIISMQDAVHPNIMYAVSDGPFRSKMK